MLSGGNIDMCDCQDRLENLGSSYALFYIDMHEFHIKRITTSSQYGFGFINRSTYTVYVLCRTCLDCLAIADLFTK